MFRARTATPRRLLVVSIVVITSALGTSAYAGESSRLSYVRGSGAEECPDERALRLAVAIRLGYDPFVAWAKTTIHAQIARDRSKLRAQVYLAGEDGRSRGSRELVGALDDCDRLVAAMSLAISIAIDPMSVNAKEHPDAGVSLNDEETSEAPEPPATTAPGAARDERPPLAGADDAPVSAISPAVVRTRPGLPSRRWYVGMGPALTTGTAPDLAMGAAGFARVDIGPASVGLEARYDFPAAANASQGNGTVRSTLLLLSVEPCLRFRPLALCGLASIGSLRGEGAGVSAPLEESALYVGAGVRAALEVAITEPLSVRLHADLVGNLTRVTLRIQEEEVWRTPALAATAGLDAVARIW